MPLISVHVRPSSALAYTSFSLPSGLAEAVREPSYISSQLGPVVDVPPSLGLMYDSCLFISSSAGCMRGDHGARRVSGEKVSVLAGTTGSPGHRTRPTPAVGMAAGPPQRAASSCVSSMLLSDCHTSL